MSPFVVTYWYGVPPDTATPERYREIAEAGFTVAQISGDRKRILEQLDWCRNAAIAGMVIDGRITSAVSGQDGWRDRIREAVADYHDHPALWGYFVVDEPSAGQFPILGEIVVELKERDPDHPAYINLFPNYANEQQLGTKTYEEHVRRYVETVKPPVVSYDHYAILDDGTERPEYFPNLETVRSLSLKAGLPFWQIILVVPCLPYRNPSEADLRWQVWTTLAYGAKGVSYFTYWTPDGDNFRNAIIDPFGERTEHYGKVRLINREIGKLGPILSRLRPLGVYHSSVPYNGVRPPESGSPPQYLVGSSDEPITVGEFAGEGDAVHLIIVNRRLDRSICPRFIVKPSFRQYSQISRVTGLSNRTARLEPCEGGVCGSAWLAPGDGALVLLDR